MTRKRQKLLKLLLLTTVCNELRLLRSDRRVRRWSVRPLNKYRRKFGRFLNTFNVMITEDPEDLYKYTRLQVGEFNTLVKLLETKLRKRSCINTVTIKERLAIALSYLAQGSSMCEVARSYPRGRATISVIVKETCNVLWDVLSPIYMSPPSPEQWDLIKKQFYERWNVPNCLGAIDGKHIVIQSPNKSDIGAQGICGDSGVFRNSNFGAAILNETLNTPNTAILPGTNMEFPCFFVADEAFPLKKNIMRPYSKQNTTNETRIFNYRLSRGRRVIENAFGILASRRRILRKPIIAHPTTVDSIVKATTILHNFLRTERDSDLFINNIVDGENEYGQIIPGAWRKEVSLRHISSQGSRNYSTQVMKQRDCLRDYLISKAGRVDWQDVMLERNLT